MRFPFKRERILMGSIALLLLILAAVWLMSRPSRIDARVFFVGYMKDTRGIRENLYRVPDGSERSLALLRIENHTRDWSLIFNQGRVQLRSGDGWAFDTNQLPRVWDPPTIKAGASALVYIPVPASTNAWRCRVILTGTRNPMPWQRYVWVVLSWVGLRESSRDFVVMSPEISS